MLSPSPSASHRGNKREPKLNATPDLDDDDDANSIIDDTDVDVAVDVDVDEVLPTQKPHFLDDAMPPPEMIADFERVLTFGAKIDPKTTGTSSGEQLKMDKKYERDGEISDYELAASGYTKKEFTQDDNTLNLPSGIGKSAFTKPKHFLDENPIPPDYMLLATIADHDLRREHRSLDRNFERQEEQQSALSAGQMLKSCSNSSGGGRKSSLDRGGYGGGSGSNNSGSMSSSRTSRERSKDLTSSYTLSRFLHSAETPSPPPALQRSIPKGGAWASSSGSGSCSFDRLYGSLPMAHTGGVGDDKSALGVDDIVDVDRLGPKVECVYSLLSMLGSNDPAEMSKKFLELSRTPETCSALRRAGCVPLLVQMMHSDGDDSVRKCSTMALHNVVHSHLDEKTARRETKVLRLLEQILDYCNFLKTLLQSGGEAIADDSERHPLAAISSLMKVSFDEEHRHAMCELGALQAIPNLVHLDHAVHGPKPEDQCCNSLRRYALMALTNLTFGDEHNKAYLCSQKIFMEALVAQLDSAPDDLLQVTASVLRNLSWRADSNMKAVLNEIGTVTALARAAMKNKSENTLKAILSALWNLSAHCSTNKAEFCAVDGALAFLVDMLTYEGPSKTLKIIENAGGILRNVSSHIAVREHYRQILRERNCLSILLQQLKSESLTVVSNSCGTLWNLSARCPEDQKFLWDNGAVPMLRSLIHSKHAMISEGSASALKNLLNFRPAVQSQNPLDPIARSMGLRKLPTLNARKQKALQQELGGKQHAETCDNLDISGNTGVTKEDGQLHQHTTLSVVMHAQRQRYIGGTVPPGTSARLTRSAMLTKSESRDSVFSAKSDTTYENLMRSHSASDANRKKLPYTAAAAAAAYSLENDVEATEVEQPIDYSAKYCEKDAKTPDERTTEVQGAGNSTTNVTYQETDLDQPTDFSLRYAEHQIESDLDVLPNVRADRINSASARVTPADTLPASAPPNCGQAVVSNGNEILLILEDTVKCYQTEDTPYVISNAASVTDLRQAVIKSEAGSQVEALKTTEKPKKYQRVQQMPSNTGAQGNTAYGSGSYTPEKPINYCEEGTPGYFSRYESLSSLDESPPTQQSNTKDAKAVQMKANTTNSTKENAKPVARHAATPLPQGVAPAAQTSGNATAINSAQETPLMFSRHSSMDSLVEEGEEEIGVCDDKSSVVSDFSRLASGVISPSEIPDSPTQSLPQSPRRNSNSGHVNSSGGSGIGGFPPSVSPLAPTRGSAVGIASSSAAIGLRGGIAVGEDTKRPLCSVFEDDISTFHVENTPAQFSCRTSLSNLSILDDEISLPPSRQPPVEGDNIGQQAIVSEGEEEEAVNNIDDILLANCINMGMNRTTITAAASKKSMANTTRGQKGTDSQLTADEPKHYYTEDTPALLSKVGSNTNLSAISICSSNNMEELKVPQPPPTTAMGESDNRHSLVLSDDVSSNASESGATGQSFDLLQQCIEVGMKKPTAQTKPHTSGTSVQHRAMMPSRVADPIAMLRRGGNILPPYLPVADETNKFLVENSPCNFSVASGLSNLTVGSSLVGPAVQLKSSKPSVENAPNMPANTESEAAVAVVPEEGACMEQKWQDDSLSSLSIDSEDDTNLLSQAIAAGCNRPKSNLGFSSTSKTNNNNKRTSLSASQPIPINAATSSSSLNSSATARHYQRQEQQTSAVGAGNTSITTHRYQNGNDSYSSVDSSDSNDNQAKSLFELCIRTGMHKPTRDGANHRRQHMLNNRRGGSGTTQSNPNLKQFDSLPLQLHAQPKPMALPTNMSTALTATTTTVNRHLRERERKDEKLLLECINTGISKKIGSNSHSHSSSVGSATVAAKYAADKATHSIPMPIFIGGDGSHSTGTGSKNVLATSAAAQVLCHPHAATLSSNVHSTAAPDVAKMNNTGYNSHFTTTFSSSNSNNSNTCTDTNNSCSSVNCWETKDINNVDIIDAARSPAMDTTITAHSDVSLPNHVNAATDQKMNDTGYKEDQPVDFDQPSAHEELNSPSVSFDNTVTSDDSNESFIIETTVSLEMRQSRNSPPLTTSQKHKDPDLMLKSVERLTLEFVSSAEQLRTNATSVLAEGSVAEQHRMASGGASISIGGTSNSNNTWNEDTCPNDDVSFPSVSVTAPIVASLNYDDNDDDDDDDEDVDQATEADHKDLHDFAEITPINEEQPQPSLLMLERADTGTQPSSLETETETDTLVNDGRSIDILCYNETQESTTSSGINFQLGGAVQSAALSLGGHHMFYGSNSNAVAAAAQAAAAAAAMTNSTIIAIEARALAENLQHGGSVSADDDDSVDLTFSINSLDLDNIRPPSGMESLNMSGYYHQEPQTNAFHSLGVLQRRSSSTPQSPQMIMRSPKFPRKSLPQGLVAKRALGQLPAHLSGSAESVNSSCNLLENIKPPSLMDELLDSMISVASIQSEVADAECSMATTLSVASNYETAAGGHVEGGDYDDNTITLQSCYETMPHDMDAEENSFHSGAGSTPLPTDDCEFSSAESTPQKSAASPTPLNGEKRTLTPKQKRKVAKDRYRTFTITSNVAVSEEERQRLELEETQMSDETLQIEIIETEAVSSAGSSSRRRSDAERYRTQTIVYNTSTTKATTTIASNDMEANEANASADESAGPYSLTSTDDCASESMCSLRAMTQKFKFINMPINISKTAPEAEAAEVRGVPDGGDCTSIECDQNSETESCHDQHETYGIAENYDNQSEEDASDNSESEEHSLVKSPARARITKPTEPAAVEDVSNNDQAKAVRGRKKPIYISPYSIQYQRTMSPQTRIATNKTLTPTKTAQLHTLRKRDTNVVAPEMAGTRLPAPKKVQTQVSAGAQATTTQQGGAAPPSLDRQGTFVQEEPTITTCQVPVVVSDVKAILPPATATAGGSPQRSSKLPTKRATAVAASKSTTTSTQPAITRKIPIAAKSSSPKQRKVVTTGSTGMPQRSNSNAAIRVTSSAARVKRVSATTPPTRSNSNLNSRDTVATAAAHATKNAAAKINQAQSRIANIWKRVNDAKSKQQEQQRVPRANAARGTTAVVSKLKSQQTKSSPALNMPKKAAVQRATQQQQQQKKQTLIRSSTFDNTPNGVGDGALQNVSTKIAVNAGGGLARGGRK